MLSFSNCPSLSPSLNSIHFHRHFSTYLLSSSHVALNYGESSEVLIKFTQEHTIMSILIPFIITLFSLLLVSSSQPILKPQVDALNAFKSSVVRDPNDTLSDWSHANHHCNWTGIACDPVGNVVSITLVDSQLGGVIAPSLGNLTYLQVLDLSLNSFIGNIPPQLGSCSLLTELVLYDNSLSGSIPTELGNLKNLQLIDLGNNFLNGSIPESLCNCTSLLQLGLINNNLTGEIPRDIGNLRSLQMLVAFHNQLSGSLPSSIGKLTEMQVFDLSENRLTGKIPPEFGNMSKLEILQLHINSLSGEIPGDLGQCTKLVRLNLFTNELTGQIPSELGNLINLEALRLYDNTLQSTIPNSLFKLKNLTYLGLSRNELKGSISPGVASLRSLQILTLHSNNFSGAIPSSITKLTNLSYFSIGFNSFTGSLPTNIGSLRNLMNLTANDNRLEGPIPASIINCTSLLVVTLTNNMITGRIPKMIGRLSNLTYLSLGDNMISGEIPDDLFNCSQLQVLDLSINRLNSSLKPYVGNLMNLRSLRLAHNTLFGSIPKEIGNLSDLLYLILEGNNFSSTIPTELSKLSSLQGLWLNDNRLQGVVPEELSELKKLTDLRLSNNELVGGILDVVSKLESLSFLDISGNKLNGTIPERLSNLSKLTTLDLSDNHFTGPIPGSVLAGLKNIQIYLNLSHNLLEGSIPVEIGMLEMVQEIDISNNNLSGSIPATIKGCRNLINLDLSGNMLSDQVLGDIFPQLVQLQSLNLSRNQLFGALPEALSRLKYLSTVDLSSNKFNGTIPESYSFITSLKYLNLSFNMLEGRVPQSGVFANISSTSLQGNPSLCGKDFLKVCNTTSNPKIKRRFSKKALLILLGLGCLILLILLLSALYAIRHKTKKRNERLKSMKIEYLPSAITLKRYEAKDLAAATNSFSEENMIGSSGLSSVYRGTLEDGRNVAVKKLNLQQFADKLFYREVNTLGQLRHRNLVKVLGYAWESRNLKALVLEFMENGSLENVMYRADREQCRWTLDERVDALVSIANGLVYLHTGYDFPIVHCDLKPSNVLLDGEMKAHVSDFGTARILGIHLDDETSISTASAFEGTIGYLAPELAYMRKVTTKVDVFSYGVMMMELITRRRPTGVVDEDESSITLSQYVRRGLQSGINGLHRIVDPDLRSKKDEVVEGLLHLALSCTDPDPENRPNMEQVLSSISKIRKQ